jgi:hypothetical protein
VPRQAPAVADLATTGETWAAEYLDTEQNVIDWSREYLKENSLGGPDPLNHSEGFVRNQNAAPKWAQDYLTDLPRLFGLDFCVEVLFRANAADFFGYSSSSSEGSSASREMHWNQPIGKNLRMRPQTSSRAPIDRHIRLCL